MKVIHLLKEKEAPNAAQTTLANHIRARGDEYVFMRYAEGLTLDCDSVVCDHDEISKEHGGATTVEAMEWLKDSKKSKKKK